MASPRIPYPELKSSRLEFAGDRTPNKSNLADKIDKKILEFDVEVLDAVFNKPGRYFIKMTVQSLATKDYTQIHLRRWPYENYERDNEALTSVTRQRGTENEPELCKFDDRKFTFRLPEGFCKNDRNHDVYLLIEVFSLPTDLEGTGTKCGEGKVAIYPRTNAPRTNHAADAGEDMYRHTQVVSLLRTTNKQDTVQMHCGRMRCEFALREYDDYAERQRKKREEEELKRRLEDEAAERKRNEIKDKELAYPFQARPKISRTPGPNDPAPPPPIFSPPQAEPEREPSPEWREGNKSVYLPITPTPSPPHDLLKSVDSPRQDYDKSTYTANAAWRHTARPGNQQIDIIVHGASNLPLATGKKVPQPFATIKTHQDAEKGYKARSMTHAVVRPTNAPSWEEMVTMDLTEAEAQRQSLTLAVGDAITRDELVNYSIPVSLLKPFHQYHLELILPPRGKHPGTKLYASITRKLSALPTDPSSPNYLGLEVFLRSVKLPLQNPVGPLIAVARIVPDYYNYKSDNLLSQPRAAGVSMSRVSYPSPHPLTFSVENRSSHGYPQLSLPGRPEQQPTWNHPYMFCDEKDKATMFTPSAALVIEYYVANTAMTDEFWKIQSPVGFSSLLLDQKVYRQLCQDKATMGLRVEGVPIMGSELRSSDSKVPRIGMVLKLIISAQPESMVAMSNLDNLPLMEMRDGQGEGKEPAIPGTPDVLHIKTPTPPPPTPPDGEELLAPGMYLQRVDKDRAPIKDGEMPPYEAVESILPEYQYIFVEPNNQDTDRSYKLPAPSRSVRAPDKRGVTTGPTTAATTDLDQTHMSVLDQQMRDLDNYRTAVQRMGQDILTLRNQVRTLEGDNSRLRVDNNQYGDSRKLLIDAGDLEKLAKPELLSRYVSLRQKLASQTTELKDYKTKVQKLQNEVIKKNDKEKDYLRMSHAHASQQELLQRLQDKVQKVRRLEETCKKQEKVIEKMEGVLQKLRRDRSNKSANADMNNVLAEENARLRQQLEDLKEQLAKSGGGGEDMEKLELYQALERAEGRIMSLEKQLQENARNWGKERADMSIRMNEAEHGFGRSAGMMLHDYPVVDAAYNKTFGAGPSRLGPLLR